MRDFSNLSLLGLFGDYVSKEAKIENERCIVSHKKKAIFWEMTLLILLHQTIPQS